MRPRFYELTRNRVGNTIDIFAQVKSSDIFYIVYFYLQSNGFDTGEDSHGRWVRDIPEKKKKLKQNTRNNALLKKK